MTREISDRAHNLLVISDLHLGEDLRPGGAGVSYLRHLEYLERELAKFLLHHSEHRRDAQPWRLVVNGDMVDFMSMKILPAHPVADGDDPDDDNVYGLGFSELAAQQKMEQVVSRHEPVFAALGAFVAAGNELVVVVGNHDVEFHYRLVQQTFVDRLCALASPADAPAFLARISFCPWFYYEENRVYIEHGHQFDEYCSFDYQLHPAPMTQGELPCAERRAPSKSRPSKSRFALSMAHSGMRFFANQLPEYDPHTAESWGFTSYFRWALALGWTGLARISYLYGLLVWKVVEAWYGMRNADAPRRAAHLSRMKALSRQWELTEEKLLALSALHRVPVTRRFFGVLRALFLDRVLLSGFGVGAALGLVVALTGQLRWAIPLLLVAGVVVMNDKLGKLRLASSAERLRSVPRLLQALVGVPLVVLGHSHAPERVALPNGAEYINTGTWASEDARVAFTHLIIDRRGGQAELRQWRDGESAPFVLPDLT
ncbi:MAG: metallophosphoesterase [Polyangia bacterium]